MPKIGIFAGSLVDMYPKNDRFFSSSQSEQKFEESCLGNWEIHTKK